MKNAAKSESDEGIFFFFEALRWYVHVLTVYNDYNHLMKNTSYFIKKILMDLVSAFSDKACRRTNIRTRQDSMVSSHAKAR